MAPFHIQKHKMAHLLRSLTDRFTPNASSTDLTATERRKDGFLTAKGADALFQRTKAEIDGDDCLHDCESCTVSLPRKWAIDEDDKLYGHIQGWTRHLLVATGKSDWVRDVAWSPTPLSKSYIASASQDHTVRIWTCAAGADQADASNWKSEVLEFEVVVWRCSWSMAGNVLAVSGGDNRVSLWKEKLRGGWEVVKTIEE